METGHGIQEMGYPKICEKNVGREKLRNVTSHALQKSLMTMTESTSQHMLRELPAGRGSVHPIPFVVGGKRTRVQPLSAAHTQQKRVEFS